MLPRGVLGYLFVLCTLTLVTKECGSAVASQPASTNVSSRTNPTVASDDDDEDFVPYQGERFNVFDWNFFKVMGRKYSGNVLTSPASLKLALILLYEGAQDQTAHELAGVMQLPVSRPATRDRFASILQSLQMTSPAYTLNVGTRIYIDANILLRQRYAAIAKTFYNADVISANLSETGLIAQQINTWAKNVTEGNIEKIIQDESSLKDAVMLVMNALFFKGTWRRQFFSPQNTFLSKFYTNVNESVDVPFMHTVGRFYYSESAELDAKILRLPYDGHKYAMYIILPTSLSGLDQLLVDVNPFILTRHVWLMQELPVEVTLPKFKFDFTSHLEEPLREIGIRDIFDDTATLTGIARTKRTSRHLLVSDVVQKTGIEVNEMGTTAYATTEIKLGNKMADQIFNANHPFLFYVEDESTGTILYLGKVSNPQQLSGDSENRVPDTPSRFGPGETSTSRVPVAPSSSLGVPTSEERYNFFNIDLLQAINEDVDGNVIISPTSVKSGLTTLLEGTGGRTRQQLLSTLRLPSDLSLIRGIIEQSTSSLKSTKNNTEVDIATRLWVNADLNVKSNYLNALEKYYSTDVSPLNFTNVQHSVDLINTWARQVTRNKVRTIVDHSSLNTNTCLLLTSALYFKGKWLKSFNKNDTRLTCFHVPNHGCENIPVMESLWRYRYAYIPSLDANVIEIPYSDKKTSMLILLPNNAENDQNLRILSKDLSYIPMSVLLSNLVETEILLSLPKFSIESELNLRPALTRLGIQDLFGLSANLSGISSDSSLHVSSVLQNAKIEVDEEGTKADALTSFQIVPLMGPSTFIANRPFLFAIVDLETNSTLFAGRFINPNSNIKNSNNNRL